MIWAIVAYIESRVETGIVYADLAKAMGFSLPHLRAIFVRHTGQPLAHYILSRRVARAAFDVVHTGDTLLVIAARYGFANPDTFTRAFRRVTGYTPQAFRKQGLPVGRVKLCAGVYGVSIAPNSEGGVTT